MPYSLGGWLDKEGTPISMLLGAVDAVNRDSTTLPHQCTVQGLDCRAKCRRNNPVQGT